MRRQHVAPTASPPSDDFHAAGYEVHVNLSPVVVHDGRLDDWRELLGLITRHAPYLRVRYAF
ncbi:hypothetical protein ACQPZF_25040 [Actinosynnema sp. CS-041913]|uniref:hypothetical protein n=1 Tax=Actinosynnema sp. CS-041913 TaxID=3239917 RepID=UPI003D8B4BB5